MFGDFVVPSGEKFEVTGEFPAVVQGLNLLRGTRSECDEITLLAFCKKSPQIKTTYPRKYLKN